MFSESFDAAAAQNVVSGDGLERWDVLDALDELVVKSMVVAERVGPRLAISFLRHYATMHARTTKLERRTRLPPPPTCHLLRRRRPKHR